MAEQDDVFALAYRSMRRYWLMSIVFMVITIVVLLPIALGGQQDLQLGTLRDAAPAYAVGVALVGCGLGFVRVARRRRLGHRASTEEMVLLACLDGAASVSPRDVDLLRVFWGLMAPRLIVHLLTLFLWFGGAAYVWPMRDLLYVIPFSALALVLLLLTRPPGLAALRRAASSLVLAQKEGDNGRRA